MAGSTTRAGLYKAGGGSSGAYGLDESADIDKAVNDNLDKIDGLLGLRKVTSTTRPATPMDGQIIYETDTQILRYWNLATTSWDRVGGAAVPAIVPITPTSVAASLPAAANAVVNADGSVTFTNATEVNLQGIFSAAFRSYEIEYEIDSFSAVGALVGRLASGGTPVSTTTYFMHTSYGDAATHTDADSLSNSYMILNDYSSTSIGMGKVRIMSPFLAKITQFISEWSRLLSAGTRNGNGMVSGWQSAGTSFDGLVLRASTGVTMTGWVRVRGLA